MRKLTLDEMLNPIAEMPQEPDGSETRRRAAVAMLFTMLPSQTKLAEERALQLEGYAHALGDIPAAVVEKACKLLIGREKWLPRIGEIRECCGKLLRQVRWKATRGGPWSDYNPTDGVVFDSEREINWARRNARALASGDPFPQVSASSFVPHDTPANREALRKAQAQGRLLDVKMPERYPDALRIGPGGEEP